MESIRILLASTGAQLRFAFPFLGRHFDGCIHTYISNPNSLLNAAAKGASVSGNEEWVGDGLKTLKMMEDNKITPDVV